MNSYQEVTIHISAEDARNVPMETILDFIDTSEKGISGRTTIFAPVHFLKALERERWDLEEIHYGSNYTCRSAGSRQPMQ